MHDIVVGWLVGRMDGWMYDTIDLIVCVCVCGCFLIKNVQQSKRKCEWACTLISLLSFFSHKPLHACRMLAVNCL